MIAKCICHGGAVFFRQKVIAGSRGGECCGRTGTDGQNCDRASCSTAAEWGLSSRVGPAVRVRGRSCCTPGKFRAKSTGAPSWRKEGMDCCDGETGLCPRSCSSAGKNLTTSGYERSSCLGSHAPSMNDTSRGAAGPSMLIASTSATETLRRQREHPCRTHCQHTVRPPHCAKP